MKRIDVAYVLLIDEQEENVLLVKNKGPRASYYTLPGGAVEQGGTLEEAAIREVNEETAEIKLWGINDEIGVFDVKKEIIRPKVSLLSWIISSVDTEFHYRNLPSE